ncbi:hypothetical protein [Mycolicibacterium sediminis]|uniref:Uncharacterized protein n=1 Tax=Mycolicibacterium sediminis TaxID=1286180 RepID=A0A7I7QUA1_9MYCO|nr:hypothetical protein [Mycolicibacterium sediminis]BBY29557.1 hypothetical protein MSEDJ_36530 [Mycolicibacterium sediminis]
MGPSATEAFIIIAIATILLTRGYLRLTGYPQIGGGNLHIAHALWGGALMMLALVIGWMTLGLGARMLCVVLGGIGFGLFLDEVGKFVTKDNDYFYGPSAEIMYVLVVVILVGARMVRDVRPLNAVECLASAALIAADGIARGLAHRRREIGVVLVERARDLGADADDVARVHDLLLSADPASDRVYAAQRRALALIPGFFRSPRWVPVVGWLLVLGSFLSVSLGTLGVAIGGYFYSDDHLTVSLDGFNVPSAILLVSAVLTLCLALPAMIGRRRTDGVWPLRWLRNAALIFTLLNALVDFATEGFGALITLSIGLFALAILSYRLDVAVRAGVDLDGVDPAVTPPARSVGSSSPG